MTKRKDIDWEGIETEYRAGLLSERKIATQFGVSHTAIQNKAKKGHWKRDLHRAVREQVAKKLVANELASIRSDIMESGNSQQIVEVMANQGAQVVTGHQTAIQKNRALAELLLEQVHEAMREREELKEIIDEETKKDSTTKRRNRLYKAVSIPTHTTVVKDLTMALKNLIPLERQAFSLNDTGIPLSDLERLLPPPLFESLIENLRGQLGE